MGAGPKSADIGEFFLRAYDPKTGAKKWEYPIVTPTADAWAGTVSTAGGVVFFCDDHVQLIAVEATNGEHLWHFGMGEVLTASPITYAVDGSSTSPSHLPRRSSRSGCSSRRRVELAPKIKNSISRRSLVVLGSDARVLKTA